jgi:casein kinase II subunit beta
MVGDGNAYVDLESADMSTSSGPVESWISSYCSTIGHEYFAEVSEEFIEDDFNLTGLQTQVAMYKEALEVGTTPTPLLLTLISLPATVCHEFQTGC